MRLGAIDISTVEASSSGQLVAMLKLGLALFGLLFFAIILCGGAGAGGAWKNRKNRKKKDDTLPVVNYYAPQVNYNEYEEQRYPMVEDHRSKRVSSKYQQKSARASQVAQMGRLDSTLVLDLDLSEPDTESEEERLEVEITTGGRRNDRNMVSSKTNRSRTSNSRRGSNFDGL